MSADAWGAVKLPRARLKAEVGGGQRADGANVGGVAAEVRIKWRVTEGDDFHMAAAVVKLQHMIVSHVILKADAAAALNTALTIQEDQVAERHVLGIVLFGFVLKAA